MKIAILTPTFNHYSGIDRVVEAQAEDYVKKGDKVTVIALESQIKPKNYEVITLGMPKSTFMQRVYRLFFFLDSKKLNFYKKLKNYDLIISHFYPMNWLAYKARKKYNIKYVYFNHGVNMTGLPNNTIQKIYMELFSFFTNITLSNVDQAFSISKYLQDDLKKVSN
jgi:glycosyltransferase involved in cell wall biosynthesis